MGIVVEQELSRDERLGALIMYYLARYDITYARAWVEGEFGAGKVEEFEEYLDGHNRDRDCSAEEQKYAMLRALHDWTAWQIADTKDGRLIGKIAWLAGEVAKAKSDLQHWLSTSSDGGGDVFLGSEKLE